MHAHQHAFQLLQQFGPARRLGTATAGSLWTTRTHALAGTGLDADAAIDDLVAGTAFVGLALARAAGLSNLTVVLQLRRNQSQLRPLLFLDELHVPLAFLCMFLQRPVVEIS